MNAYSRVEWIILRVGLFSMIGLALISMCVGFAGMALENRTILGASGAGLAGAAAIGGTTVIILQITGRRRRQRQRDRP